MLASAFGHYCKSCGCPTRRCIEVEEDLADLAVYKRARQLAAEDKNISWAFSQIMLHAQEEADNDPAD